MADQDTTSERLDRLVRLLEIDYVNTTRFIDGVLSTTNALRALAITLWLAAVGGAATFGVWAIALAAAGIPLAFALLDRHQSWLYRVALSRATEIERLWRAYFESLGRGADDEELVRKARAGLEAHRFGLFLNFLQFDWRELKGIKPTAFFEWIYWAMLVGALLLAAILGGREIYDHTSGDDSRGHNCHARIEHCDQDRNQHP